MTKSAKLKDFKKVELPFKSMNFISKHFPKDYKY